MFPRYSSDEAIRRLLREGRAVNQRDRISSPYTLTEGTTLYLERPRDSEIGFYVDKIQGDKYNRSVTLKVEGVEGLEEIRLSRSNRMSKVNDISLRLISQGRATGRKIELQCDRPSNYKVKIIKRKQE